MKICEHKILVLILFLSLIIRLSFYFYVTPWDSFVEEKIILYDDPYEYHSLALNLINHGEYTSGNKSSEALRTPLYPFFIFVIYYIFGIKPFVVIIFQILIELLSIFLIFLIIKKIFNKTSGFLGAIIYGINPLLIFYSNTLFSDSLLVFFMTLFFYLVSRVIENDNNNVKRYLNYIAVGFVLGLSTLLKPIIAYMIYPLLLYLFLYNYKKSFRYIILLVITYYMTVTPWMYHNYNKYGKFDLSTSKSHNLILLIAAPIKSTVETEKIHICASKLYLEADSLMIFDGKNPSVLSDFQKSKYWEKVAINYIVNNPGIFVVQFFNGVIHSFFNLNTTFISKYLGIKYYNEKPLQSKEYLNIIDLVKNWFIIKSASEKIIGGFIFSYLIFFYFLTVKGALIIFKKRQIPKKYSIFIFFIILYFILITGPMGLTRFTLPLIPYFIFFAAQGTFFYFEWFSKNNSYKLFEKEK